MPIRFSLKRTLQMRFLTMDHAFGLQIHQSLNHASKHSVAINQLCNQSVHSSIHASIRQLFFLLSPRVYLPFMVHNNRRRKQVRRGRPERVCSSLPSPVSIESVRFGYGRTIGTYKKQRLTAAKNCVHGVVDRSEARTRNNDIRYSQMSTTTTAIHWYVHPSSLPFLFFLGNNRTHRAPMNALLDFSKLSRPLEYGWNIGIGFVMIQCQ